MFSWDLHALARLTYGQIKSRLLWPLLLLLLLQALDHQLREQHTKCNAQAFDKHFQLFFDTSVNGIYGNLLMAQAQADYCII